MSSILSHLGPYVPPAVIRHVLAVGPAAGYPRADRLQGALVRADITSVTSGTGQPGEREASQVQEIASAINAYCGKLMDLISAHGGEVVELTGDSMLIFWPGAIEGIQTATRRAAYCAMQMQARLQGQRADGQPSVGFSLRLGMGAGEMASMHLRGKHWRRYHVLAGQPVAQVASALHQTKAGDVVVSPQAFEHLQATCIGLAKAGEGFLLGAVGDSLPLRRTFAPPMIPEMETSVRAYIPEMVLTRLNAAQNTPLAEFCQVAAVVFRLTSTCDDIRISSLQAAVEHVEDAVSYYEGQLLRLTADDSGIMALAAFGLLPSAHRDEAVRAVWAAMLATTKSVYSGVPIGAGIASGQALYGTVLGERRSDHIVVGDVVRLAARLAQPAGDGIVCDEATFLSARSRLTFEALPPTGTTDEAERILLYRPLP